MEKLLNFNFVDRAENFAKLAHDSINQRRKYSDEPYWVHPERVANVVSKYTEREEVIAAAWLHDVLEDVAPFKAEFNEDAINNLFGSETLTLVLEVTDVSKPSDGNRATRKAIDREHLKSISSDGKLIKLADLIDNMIDIDRNDPNFAKVFRREAAELLPHLEGVCDPLYLSLYEALVKK